MWKAHGLVTQSGVESLALSALVSETAESANYCQKLSGETLSRMTNWVSKITDIAMVAIDVLEGGFAVWQSSPVEQASLDKSSRDLLDAAYKLVAILAQVSGRQYEWPQLFSHWLI